LLNLGGPEKASCAEVRKIAKHHLDDIRAKIKDLAKLERLLAKTIARCSGKSVPDCRFWIFLMSSEPCGAPTGNKTGSVRAVRSSRSDRTPDASSASKSSAGRQ
jgi:hypothetical protein